MEKEKLEIRLLQAQLWKTEAEIAKVIAETDKLIAETDKVRKDVKWYFIALFSTILAALTTLIALIKPFFGGVLKSVLG